MRGTAPAVEDLRRLVLHALERVDHRLLRLTDATGRRPVDIEDDQERQAQEEQQEHGREASVAGGKHITEHNGSRDKIDEENRKHFYRNMYRPRGPARRCVIDSIASVICQPARAQQYGSPRSRSHS